MNQRRAIVIFGIAIIAVLGLVGLFGWGLIQRNAPPLATGLPPDFTLTTFDGQTIKLSDLKGKVVIINFWASWCVPCRDEAPFLERAWQTYKDRGVVILGIDYLDTDAEAKKFMQEFGITYPNGADLGSRISQAYRITGVPETYFVTKDGRLFEGTDEAGRPNGNWIGPLTEEVLTRRIEQMLGK
jgi:cytochrome c biogenesis protein CcmG/thiol:disulfide interchange protein DsbE